MTIQKVKSYLEKYNVETDDGFLTLETWYDFEIKENELYCYLIDSAEPTPDRFGFWCKIELAKQGYIVVVANIRQRWKNIEFYRSRRAIAELLKAEIVY